MKLFGIRYFNFAGPNDFVTLTRGGREVAAGKGLAGFIRPSTSVSIVPLGVKTVNFQVTERSSDAQQVTVGGELVVQYVPEMRDSFDFSVFRDTGMYRNDPTAQIEDQVRIAVRSPLRAALAAMNLATLSGGGAQQLEQVLQAEVANAESALMLKLKSNNISVQSAAVKSALPANRDTAAAFGAEQREKLLAEQDKAIADRRMEAAVSDREIREYEEETAKELAMKQAARIDEEGKNTIKRAEAAAEAASKELALYVNKPAEELLALALLRAAENGIGSLSVDPSLLAAIRSAGK